VIGVVEARLPAEQVRLVPDVEDVEALDRLLAAGELEGLPVVTGLGSFVDGVGGRLRAPVRVDAELGPGDSGLPNRSTSLS